jgi:hypothetical protein
MTGSAFMAFGRGEQQPVSESDSFNVSYYHNSVKTQCNIRVLGTNTFVFVFTLNIQILRGSVLLTRVKPKLKLCPNSRSVLSPRKLLEFLWNRSL